MSEDDQAAFTELVGIVDRLRRECPWDREQTHGSLTPYVLEEAYEVVEAIDAADSSLLQEELGDLLLQVVLHARLAEEDPEPFGIAEVTRGVSAKLVRRHPHVFADGAADSPAAVNAAWERIKADEKQRDHVLDGIPAGQSALARAQKTVSRLRKAGLLDDMHLVTVEPPVGPSAGTADADPADGPFEVTEESLGQTLLSLAVLADSRGIDAETALRSALRTFEQQARAAR